MDDYPLLSSVQNSKVKDAVRLRDRRDRDKTGLFVIEGYRELLRAEGAEEAFVTLFICPELFLGENEPTLIKAIEGRGAQVFTCAASVFKKLSYRDRPDGLIAIARQRTRILDDLEEIISTTSAPCLVVAEAIEKPGNLGTILRSADASDVDAVLVCDKCTDIYNPNVVRASVGTLFTVPVVQCSSKDAIKWLRKHNIAVAAATPHADDIYTDVDFKQGVAIAVGTEQLGLSELWMSQADIQVRIPMRGVADSLNVATATTLLLYEVLRQRS